MRVRGASSGGLMYDIVSPVHLYQSCRLRKLPHVLTFALLRFLYNFQKGERYKVQCANVKHDHIR